MLIANVFRNPITLHSETNSIEISEIDYPPRPPRPTPRPRPPRPTLTKTKRSSEKVEYVTTAAGQYSTQFDQIKNSGTFINVIILNRHVYNYNVKQNTIAKVHFDLLEHHTYECICVKDFCDNGSYALGKKGEKYQVDGYCVTKSPDYPGKVDKVKCKMGVYGQAGGWNCVASDLSS